MRDAIAQAYAAHPYPNYLHDFAHPERIFATVALYGLPRPSIGAMRILELGCNRGHTLNWIAKSLPLSLCHGIDIDTDGIAIAQADAPANATFSIGDLTALDLGDAQYDYIIAQGMFSWVGDPAREAILALAGRHLAPGGVAMISWNAHPGSLYRSAVRELMLLEGGAGRPVTKALERLQTGLADFEGKSHHGHLSSEVTRLLAADPDYVRHDEGGVEMEPFYLMQIAGWAAEYGLSYLVDCGLGLDWLSLTSPATQKALEGLTRIEALQYLDYLHNTPFRRSLFVRDDDKDRQRPDPDPFALAGFVVEANFDIMGKGSEAKVVLCDRPATISMPQSGAGIEFLQIVGRVTPCPVPDLIGALGDMNQSMANSTLLQAAAQEFVYLKVPSDLSV